MPVIKSEIKQRYEKLEPSTALLRRTEKMMAKRAEKKKKRTIARAATAIALLIAVLCFGVGGLILPRANVPDNVQPLSSDPTPTSGPDDEILSVFTMPSPVSTDTEQTAQAAGVTLTVHNFGTTEDSVFAEWTVQSALPGKVYYAVEYDIVHSGDIGAHYMNNVGVDRSMDAFHAEDGETGFEVPTLQELTPEQPEFSGSLRHSYSSDLPEGHFTMVFTLHVYTAAQDALAGIADWGDQQSPTAYEQTFSPESRHFGDMHVYNADQDCLINNIPAYQQALIALQREGEVSSEMYLEALIRSGVFVKICEETQEFATEEISYKNKTELTGLVYELPNRTVHVDSFVVTPNTLEMRYRVVMKDMEFTNNDDDRTENTIFYVLDDNGGFIATAADGNTINTGASVTPYATEDGGQAYDCWLRFNVDLQSMPEYFIFAPHRQQSLRYAGELADRFERLYRLTNPNECFAISLNGEIVELAANIQTADGISFTLDKTECTSGMIDIEWTVESSLEEDIVYFIESSFVSADDKWNLPRGSGGYSVDLYGEFALFSAPSQYLSPSDPSSQGHNTIRFSSSVPCPGGEMILTLRAFRAADGGSLQEPKYAEALMVYYDESAGDPPAYADLMTRFGLLEKVATVRQSFEVPAYRDATVIDLSNLSFEFQGRSIYIETLRVTPTGIDLYYDITGEDFSVYTDEREYEGMYFVAAPYGSAFGLGHLDRANSNDEVRKGSVIEDDWMLEKMPEYIVLVPYGKMSYEEYMALRTGRADGSMEDRLREMYYSQVDAQDCIRIYLDGRVTTNDPNDQQIIPSSTLSEPQLSTQSEPNRGAPARDSASDAEEDDDKVSRPPTSSTKSEPGKSTLSEPPGLSESTGSEPVKSTHSESATPSNPGSSA